MLGGGADEAQPAPLESVQLSFSCWTKGSLVRKRPNERSCPDSGSGTASGSARPSPPGLAETAVALPPLSEGAAIGPVVAVVDAGVEAAESFTFGGCSIFIVRGT